MLNMPCNVGDIVYVVKNNEVLEFEIDCIKIWKNHITVHGYRQLKTGEKYRVPREYNLKYFGKRIIFATREEAISWLFKRLKAGN